MHTSAQLHSGAASHKAMKPGGSGLLKLYYTRRDVLFCVCAGNELLFLVLYLHPHVQHETGRALLLAAGLAALPVCVFKQVVNVVQMVRASMVLAACDVKERRRRRRVAAASIQQKTE